MAEAPDEAARAELATLRERLNSRDVRNLARDLEKSRPRRDSLVLEFHDPLFPIVLTVGGCVIATAVCWFAVVGGFKSPIASIGGWTFNLWVVAAFTGGTMTWPEIRSLRERAQDRVLEIHAASGNVYEIPMRLANYPVLRQHLENMVILYGERPTV